MKWVTYLTAQIRKLLQLNVELQTMRQQKWKKREIAFRGKPGSHYLFSGEHTKKVLAKPKSALALSREQKEKCTRISIPITKDSLGAILDRHTEVITAYAYRNKRQWYIVFQALN